MNRAIFFDSETSGLPLYGQPSDHPRQPHIVQLAAVVVDLDTRKVIHSMDVIVRPDGWTIPDEVVAIHGISTEHAMDVGIPEALAVDMFMLFWQLCSLRVGHNESFDARILRIALKRHSDPHIPEGRLVPMSDVWKAGNAACTQRMTTPLLTKHRHAQGLKGKTCSLAEAHELIVGKPLEGAHSAMADVQGCMSVYWAIKDLQTKQAA